MSSELEILRFKITCCPGLEHLSKHCTTVCLFVCNNSSTLYKNLLQSNFLQSFLKRQSLSYKEFFVEPFQVPKLLAILCLSSFIITTFLLQLHLIYFMYGPTNDVIAEIHLPYLSFGRQNV